MAEVRLASPTGRAILASTVLGSGIAFLDGTVVNAALPHIARDLNAGFSTMQWVLDSYLLTLGALVLVGGALGDVIGRRRVFLAGLFGFALSSAVCGAAPTGTVLVLARAVQGIAGALLIPGSLALLTASIDEADRDRAIGAWSGLAGLAGALGPFLGGWLVDAASWRWAFFINLPVSGLAILTTLRAVPESCVVEQRDRSWRSLDIGGATLVAASLALLVVPLIEADRLSVAVRVALFVAAAVAFGGWLWVEHIGAHPMVPLRLLSRRTFAVANGVTFVVYGALSGALFLLSVQLQNSLGYSALEAGASMVPLTVLLLLFSARIGALVPRIGARPLLTAGPLLAGVGLALLTRAQPGASYVTGVLPGVLTFAVGMCLVVAPITSTAMGALDREHAGLASGVNNAVARVAGLIAVAVLPAVAGTPSGAQLSEHGFRVALWLAAITCMAGGALALVGLPRRAIAVSLG